jgi:HEAT repeat protein
MNLRLILALALSTTACADHAKHSVKLYESGDYAGAARAADQELANHPDDDGLWGMRIRSALAQGDSDGVAKAYAAYMGHRDGLDTDLLRDLAIATLGQALASPSTKLKIAAIDAVEAAELEALAEQVAQKMGDDNDRVAASAAIAVLHGFAQQAAPVAGDLLKSEDPEARRIIVDGLGKKVGKLALADLEHAGDDADPKVRRVALRWLGTLKDRDAVEVLTKHVKDPDEGVRATAFSALAKIDVGNLEGFGKQALADKALSVRTAGVELLLAAHREDELVAILDDPDALVAVAAAVALHKARPELANKAIERAVASPEWTVRTGAANQLVAALGKQAALPVANRLARDPNLEVRLAAARVLAHDGDRAGAAAVFAAAMDNLQAIADLAELGDHRGVEALDAAVRDAKRSPDQRAEAAGAHRVAHRVTPGLVAALADQSGIVRVAAAATLALLAK